MKILKYIRRNSIISFWLLSYIVMFFLPLTMGIMVYFYAADIVEEEVIRANTVVLQQNQQRIDSIITEAKSLANQIMSSPRTQTAQGSVRPMDNADMYKAYELAKELKLYQSGVNGIAYYYVYLRNADFVVSHSVNLDARDFYDIYVPHETYSYEQWLDTLFSGTEARFVRMHANTHLKNDIQAIAYIQPMPYYQRTNYSAVAVLLIDEQELLRPVKDDALFGKGAFAVLDNNNRVIAETGDMPDLTEWAFEPDGGEGHSEWYDGDLFMTYVTSNTTGWRYVGVNPKSVFWAKTEALRWFVIISMLIYLLLGLVVITFFLRKNYAPVRELVELFGKKDDSDMQRSDEFSYIRKGISQAIDEKEQIYETLNAQKRSIFISMLTRLLEGDFDGSKDNELFLELMQGYFPHPHFAVVLFHIDDISSLFAEEKMNKNKRYQEATFIIENIVKELLIENSFAILFEMKNMLVCIVNRKDDSTAEFTAEMEEIIGKLQEVVDQYFHFKYSMAMGAVYSGADGIGKSYQEAYSVYSGAKMEDSLVARVTRYVDANYMDVTLNVNAIAASIGLNAAYLSTAFKEQSGQRLLDYINHVRIQHASELLKQTDYTLEKIAGMTGFVSLQTFSRVFKKYRGVTPNVYRKLEHPEV